MSSLITLLLVGFAAQLIDGSLGMAYGVTSTTLLLSTGVTPAIASASVHLAEVGTTLVSGIAHWRFGNIDWRTVRMVALPGAVGAFLGAVVLSSLSTAAARPWTSGVLLALGLFILVRFSLGLRPRLGGRPYVRHRYLAALGLTAGFVDATGGGGWGPVATPALIASGKMEPRKVIGSVDTSEFVVALAASAGFLAGMGVAQTDLRVVGALLAGGVVAAPIAAWLVRRVNPRFLGSAVGGLIVFTNLHTIAKAVGLAGAARVAAYSAALALWAVATLVTVVSMRRRAAEPAAVSA